MKMFFPFGLSNINSLLIKRIQENIHLPHTKAIEVRFNISAFWTSNKKERIDKMNGIILINKDTGEVKISNEIKNIHNSKLIIDAKTMKVSSNTNTSTNINKTQIIRKLYVQNQ